MAICLAMAFSFDEDDVMAFMLSTLMTFGSGCIFLFFGHDAENSLSRRDAYVVVTAAWMVFSIFGMFPFLAHGCITNITDAFLNRLPALPLQELRLSTMWRYCHTVFSSGDH